MLSERLRVFFLIPVAALILPLPIRAAATDPTFSVTVSPIQIYDGAPSGDIDLVFKVTGLPDEQVSLLPTVKVLQPQRGGPLLSPPDPSVRRFALLPKGGFYAVSVHVSRMALNSDFTAPVLIDFPKTRNATEYSEVLSFKISNALPVMDADIVPGSNTLFLANSRDTEFTVNLKGSPLRGLTACQSTLSEVNTGDLLDERYLNFYLDKDGYHENPQESSNSLTLSAPSTKVHLMVSPDFHSRGVFTGNVVLCSASKASVSTLKLTVNSSSWDIRAFGGFLILAGIMLYVLVSVVLKQRSNQLSALLPASRLVEALQGLRSSTSRVQASSGVSLPVLLGPSHKTHSIEWLISQLSEQQLKNKGFLPSLLPNPFQTSSTGTDYQQFLQGISAQELNLAVIVRDGLEYAMSINPAPDHEALSTALEQLDKLALEADSTDPMRPKVDAIVNAIEPAADPDGLAPRALVTNLQRKLAATHSVHELTVQLERLSVVGWLIWGFASFVMGFLVLILSNHGFGTWQDLSKCFLWGLGVQAAGQGLQGLNPSSAASSFSLQICK